MPLVRSYSDLVILLCNGINQRRLYFDNHPRVRELGREFVQTLHGLLQRDHKRSFFLGVAEGRLVHDGHYLVGPTIVGRRLTQLARDLQSGGFLFEDGLEVRELADLLGLATELSEPFSSLKEARASLASRQIEHIKLSPIYEDPGWFGQFFFEGTDTAVAAGDGDAGIVLAHQSLYEAVQTAHGRTTRSEKIDVDEARKTTEQLLKATQGDFIDIMQLVQYPDYDSYTIGHSVRVALIFVIVCHHMGVDRELLLELGAAGLLHDVGKGQIPEAILYKPGRLDEEERRIMERHPVIGAYALIESGKAGSLAVAAAWGHHLRPDGKGYPAAPDWVVTSWVTKLLHVCDVFEALTAVRPYKREITPRRAYELMVEDRGGYDPGALRRCIAALGFYPPGCRVLLDTGQAGVVMSAGREVDRPVVRLTHDVSGLPIDRESAPVLDLGAAANANEISVSGIVRRDAASAEILPGPFVARKGHAAPLATDAMEGARLKAA